MTLTATTSSETVGLPHIVLLTVVYFIAARLGFELAFVYSNVSTIWPASGIALAAGLRYGPRILLGVIVGDFLAGLSTGMPPIISAVITVGVTLEVLFGVWLLNRLHDFDTTLQKAASVLSLIVVAALVSTVAASIGTGALIISGFAPTDQIQAIWMAWLIGDAMGIILVVPLLLAWQSFDWAEISLPRRLELFAVLAVLTLMALVIEPGYILKGHGHPLAYMLFSPVLWIAFRFGIWETAAAVLAVTAITLWQAIDIGAALTAATPLEHAYYLHAFLATLAFTALPLAALNRERVRIERELGDSKDQMSMALQSAHAGAWEWVIGAANVRWSRETFQLLGLDPDEDVGTFENWLKAVHPDDRNIALAELDAATRKCCDFSIEFRVLYSDGRVRWINSLGRMIDNPQGGPATMHGIVIDITDRKQMQSALSNEMERAKITLTSIADAVITTDAEGHVQQINPMAKRLTGWDKDMAHGKLVGDVFRLVSEDTETGRLTPTCAEIVAGQIIDLDSNKQLLSKTGQLYSIEFSAAPIRDSNKQGVGCVLVFRDVTEKNRLQNQIAWQAGHDVLTGLPNRALLSDRLQQAQAHAGRHRQLLGVCFLDLDNFKPVNDEYGHECGDQLLIEVASRLTQILRAGDTVARLGGDEFVLLITDINDMDNLEEMLNRILKNLAEPYIIKGTRISLTASIGVTVYPLDDADADTLLRRADQAMYMSKQTGRNTFKLFDAEHDREENKRRLQHNRVHQALSNDELAVYYQPQVDMHSGRVMGMEALIRWQHPERGLLGPMDFLPLVEHSALIIDIGEWVLRQAIQQIIAWSRIGLQLPVSVNIAARHLQLPDFVARLRALLDAYPELAPHSLQLEILESAALVDIQQVRTVIHNCHAMDVSVALDDFGTGYSSLSYLKQLPTQTLKIDRSFVRDMLDDDGDLALIEGVIGLAGAFQRKVVAEGVESAEQGVLLMRLGCDLAQGYGIAKPMPSSEVVGWVAGYQPDPQWALWADARWELTDFPLLVAQYDHQRWVRRVLRAVEEGVLLLSYDELHDHTHCRFGQWYENGGRKRYGHLAVFKEVDPVHARMHAVGPEIIRLRESGRLDLARTQIPELLKLQEQIMERLNLLQQAVAQISRDKKRGPSDNLLLFRARPTVKK